MAINPSDPSVPVAGSDLAAKTNLPASTENIQENLTGSSRVHADHTLPEGRWEFDAGVTSVFDEMLARSIPQYDVMRDACYELGRRYVKHETCVVDLGCSRGEAMARLVDKFGAHCRFIGVETSAPMLAAARERFKGYSKVGVVDVRDMDLRKDYPSASASLTLAVLTVQFVPIEHRQRLLRNVYTHTVPGGAFLMVEKVLGATAEIDASMVAIYHSLKANNGYSAEEVERKRLSLEGVLVPVTARMNEELLRGAGFAEVDSFWRWQNFAGWLAVKA